jgi:hypothetical protein
MKVCEYCGGACRKAVRFVRPEGTVRCFDCVECALAALYPACETCGSALAEAGELGPGESAYCSPLCAGATTAQAA